jgi:hypothetical protein
LQALQFQQVGICRKFFGGGSIRHYGPNECFVECLMFELKCSLLNRVQILCVFKWLLRRGGGGYVRSGIKDVVIVVNDRLWGLVVKSSWLQIRRLGFDSRHYQSASELYRPNDRRLSAKWLPILYQIFTDKGCHVVSVTDPYGRILGFLDRSRYFPIK